MSTSDSRDLSPAAELFAEFLAQRGGSDDAGFAAFRAAHPDHAADLQRLHRQWRRLDATLQPDATPATSVPGEERAADRYQLGDEIAHGGMGVVMQGFDRHLQRRVAIKIAGSGDPARAGGALDTRALSRFLDEARITGQLEHPGIVPIYDLGMDARSRFFFTMPLVRGQTFAAIIDSVHRGDPEWTLPRALGVLLAVCEAVASAHAKGVIHRDLKPSNVMVGRFGETYVMDWGLARVLSEPDRKDIRLQQKASDASAVHASRPRIAAEDPDSPLITMDGDVVGTPAYMPPEQARGEIDRVGPRADVYAAGAMLYHLLAGEMPYATEGARVSTHTVLARVLDGPPRPLRAQRELPAELVAICNKAMARAPEDRYADMRELATDLRAFLELRVVRAYAGGAWAELRKWVRRNKAAAVAAAAAMLASVGGTAVSLSLKGEADASAGRAMANAADADRSFSLAFDAVERMLERVGGERLDDVPRAHPVRKELLQDALAFYRELLAQRSDEPRVQRHLARAHRIVAAVHQSLGEVDEAERAAQLAVAAYERLLARAPDDVELGVGLGNAHRTLATVAYDRGQYAEAESALRRGLDGLARWPDGPAALGALRLQLHASLGLALAKESEHDDAAAELQRAVALAEALAEREPGPKTTAVLASQQHQLGYMLVQAKRNEGAREWHEKALATFERVPAGALTSYTDRANLAFTLQNLGLLQSRAGEAEAARATTRRSIDCFRALVADHPDLPQVRAGLAASLANLAGFLQDATAALPLFDESIGHSEAVIAAFPAHVRFRESLVKTYRGLLMALAREKRHRDIAGRVAKFAAVDDTSADLAGTAASYLAFAVRYAREDTALGEAERGAVIEAYVDPMLDLLREMVRRGGKADTLGKSYFDPVREHPKFVALVEELGKG